MEQGKAALVDLEAELTCSICTDILFDPQTLLDCLHTYCGSCLKEWFSTWEDPWNSSRHDSASKRRSSPYRCPSCRASVRDTRPNATVTTLLEMFLLANPSRCRTESEKEERRKTFRPGDAVLPRIPPLSKSRARQENRPTDSQLQAHAGDVDTWGPSPRSGPALGSSEERRNRTRRQSSENSNDPRRIEHQSSLRSLLSSSSIENGADIEEQVLEQILEEGLLDGIDLSQLTTAQEDELSDRIADAYRRRYQQPRAPQSEPLSASDDRPHRATEDADLSLQDQAGRERNGQNETGGPPAQQIRTQQVSDLPPNQVHERPRLQQAYPKSRQSRHLGQESDGGCSARRSSQTSASRIRSSRSRPGDRNQTRSRLEELESSIQDSNAISDAHYQFAARSAESETRRRGSAPGAYPSESTSGTDAMITALDRQSTSGQTWTIDRHSSAPVCATCHKSSPACFWKCEQCNDGDWGFCDDCVGHQRCCTHALLPLTWSIQESSFTETLLLRYQTLPIEPICSECASTGPKLSRHIHCPECTGGNYNLCFSCYDKLVTEQSTKIKVSCETVKKWRACPHCNHRTVILGYESSQSPVMATRRIVLQDIEGGLSSTESFRQEMQMHSERSGEQILEFTQRWSWDDLEDSGNDQSQIVTREESSAIGKCSDHKSKTLAASSNRSTLLMRARWAYWPSSSQAEDEIGFPKHAILKECKDINGDWYWGVYCGRGGLFPGAYAAVTDAAR